MISEVHEVISSAEKEVVPPGLSFILQEHTTSENLDDTSIKDRVQVRLTSRFNESVFKSVIGLVPKSDNNTVTL